MNIGWKDVRIQFDPDSKDSMMNIIGGSGIRKAFANMPAYATTKYMEFLRDCAIEALEMEFNNSTGVGYATGDLFHNLRDYLTVDTEQKYTRSGFYHTGELFLMFSSRDKSDYKVSMLDKGSDIRPNGKPIEEWI